MLSQVVVPKTTKISIIGQLLYSSTYKAVQQVLTTQQYLGEQFSNQQKPGADKSLRVQLLQVDSVEKLNEFEFEKKKLQILNSNLNPRETQYELNFQSKMQDIELIIIAENKNVYINFQDYLQEHLMGKLGLNTLKYVSYPFYESEELQELVYQQAVEELNKSDSKIGYFQFKIPQDSYDSQQSTEYTTVVFQIPNSEQCPKTSENFFSLCTGSNLNTKKNRLNYQRSKLFRNNPAFLQGGELYGIKGEKCIFQTECFQDECFNMKNDQAGIISMCNQGRPHTNNCQFLISLEPMNYIASQNISFAKVIFGLKKLKNYSQLNTVYQGENQKIDWSIVASGQFVSSKENYIWNDETAAYDIQYNDPIVQQQTELIQINLIKERSQDESLVLDVCGTEIDLQTRLLIEKLSEILQQKKTLLNTIINVESLRQIDNLQLNIEKITEIFIQSAVIDITNNQEAEIPQSDEIEFIVYRRVYEILTYLDRSSEQIQSLKCNLPYYKYQQSLLFLDNIKTNNVINKDIAYDTENKQFVEIQRFYSQQQYQTFVKRALKVYSNPNVSDYFQPIIEYNGSDNILITHSGDITLKELLRIRHDKGLQIQEFAALVHFVVQSVKDLVFQGFYFSQLSIDNIVYTKDAQNQYRLSLVGAENLQLLNNYNKQLFPQQINSETFEFNQFKQYQREIPDNTILSFQLFTIGKVLQKVLQKNQQESVETKDFTKFFSENSSFLGINLLKFIKSLLIDFSENISFDSLLQQIQSGFEEHSIQYPPQGEALNEQENEVENWKLRTFKTKFDQRTFTIPQIEEILENPENDEQKAEFLLRIELLLKQEIENQPDNKDLQIKRIKQKLNSSIFYYNQRKSYETSQELLQEAVQLLEDYQIKDTVLLNQLLTQEYQFTYNQYLQNKKEELFTRSVDLLNQAIYILQQELNPNWLAIVDHYMNLGIIFKKERKFKEAIPHFQEYLQLSQKVKNPNYNPFECFKYLADCQLFKDDSPWKFPLINYNKAMDLLNKEKLGIEENQELDEETKTSSLNQSWANIQGVKQRLGDLHTTQNMIHEAIDFYTQAHEAMDTSTIGQNSDHIEILKSRAQLFAVFKNVPKQPCKCTQCQKPMKEQRAESDWKCASCTKKFNAGEQYNVNCAKCKESQCYACWEKQYPEFEKADQKPLRCTYCFKDIKMAIAEAFAKRTKQGSTEWNCQRCNTYFAESKNNGYYCKCKKDAEFRICLPCFNGGENRSKLGLAIQDYQKVVELLKKENGEECEKAKEIMEKIDLYQHITKD